MISSLSLGSVVRYVGNKLKSSSLVNLATYGNKSGTSRNRLKEPRNKRKFWREGSSVQNAVPQTSIVSSFIVLPFGNALTVAMKVPSYSKTTGLQKKYKNATKATKEDGFKLECSGRDRNTFLLVKICLEYVWFEFESIVGY